MLGNYSISIMNLLIKKDFIDCGKSLTDYTISRSFQILKIQRAPPQMSYKLYLHQGRPAPSVKFIYFGFQLNVDESLMTKETMSGYSVQERIEVYKCARRKYQTIIKNNRDGVIPLYRGKF